MSYFDKFNKGKGIPFMDGADKIDMPLGEKLHVRDYGFISGNDGEFVVLAFIEYPNKFVFGNSIITGDIRTMEKDLGDKDKVLAELSDISLTFSKSMSKNKREYTSVEFTQDEQPF